MTEKLEGAAKAVQELDQAMRARASLIGIESVEETRIMRAILSLASQPVINISGETEIEKRMVFKWTHTAGIVRQDGLPICGSCGNAVTVLSTDQETGDSVYECPLCAWNTPAEFNALATVDPSFAIQDFITHALGNGSKESYVERASILVMADIHRWLSGSANGGEEKSTRTMRALRDLAAALPPTQSVVILLAPHLDLGDAEGHTHMVDWPLPTTNELVSMVRNMGESLVSRLPEVDLDNGNAEALAKALAALTYEQAKRLLRLAVVKEKRLAADMAPDLMAGKAAILQKAAGIDLTTPRFTAADVGGMEYALEKISHLPRLLSSKAKAANVRAPRGFLLGGPPGTGKSLLSEVIAAEANVPLLQWDLGETKSKWFGETEKQVKDVLRAADAIGECVLAIDEGEKQAGGQGGGDSHEVTEAVMGSLLTWMQNRQSDVMVVMTVNHPENLRVELLSRFDVKWFVDYPGVAASEQIIDIHCKRRGVTLDSHVIGEIAQVAVENELCGREIEFAVEAAMQDAFIADVPVTGEFLLDRVRKTRGQATQPRMKKAIDAMRREVAGQFAPAAKYTPKSADLLVQPGEQEHVGINL